jgi:hypothetical protein
MRNTLIFCCFILGVFSCTEPAVDIGVPSKASTVILNIPQVEISANEVYVNRENSLWRHTGDSSLVSGQVYTYYADGQLAKMTNVFEGRREREHVEYFPNGKLKLEENYSHNRLDGAVKRWGLSDGYSLVAHLQYQDGKLDGEQRKWYSSGELYQVLNIENGREEGMQRAYRKNGALYANYEARNGRIFGLKRSNLCYELDNESIVYK